jgi:hypothetical protein
MITILTVITLNFKVSYSIVCVCEDLLKKHYFLS